MIYTVTLNPALDRTIWIDELQQEDVNRIHREENYAGGKGIDVSRMIQILGGDSIALGFLGGYTGLEIEGILLNEGIAHDFVRTSEETRTNIIIHETKNGKELKFSASGPEIQPAELGLLIQKIDSLKPSPSFVVISGSIPVGLNAGIYTQLTLAFEKLGARVVLDADGDALRKGIKATPYIIKPNVKELSRIIGSEPKSKDEFVGASRKLLSGELEIVVLSAGSSGLYVVQKDSAFRTIPPEVEAVNTVGAGDAVVAGLVWGLETGVSLKDSAILGTACGTATVLSEGTAMGSRETIEKLLREIDIEEIP